MITLESAFCGEGFAGIDASPLQVAICRAAEGEPIGDDLLTDEQVERHFGCARERIGLAVPTLVCVVAGVRGGKSFLAACGAIRDVLRADCSQLREHELPRHVIVAPTVDNATATLRILVGIIGGSAALRGMLVGSPTGDTVTLRRPDGRLFEVVVVAAHRGGISLRSRWLAGATLEEAAGFGIESQGAAVSAEELLRAGQTRLLPGTQTRIITSPFGQQGLVWTLYREHFGKPGRTLVVHAPTRALNPSFPQATIDEIRARDPDGASREYDAAWVDAESSYFDMLTLRAARREGPLERAPVAGVSYVAAWDAATRGNSWTLAVGHDDGGRFVVDLARQWTGSKTAPLSPRVVIGEVADVLRPYRVGTVFVDQWSVDSLRDQASDVGLALVECSKSEVDAGYKRLATLLANGAADLPPLDVLEQDLRGVRKRVTPGGVRIDLPRTPDGRHCDFAPSVALVAEHAAEALNVSAVATPTEEAGAWEYPLGDAVICVTTGADGPSAVVVQWVVRRPAVDSHHRVDGELVAHPRFFEERCLLRVLAATDLPWDVDDAAAIVRSLAKPFESPRLWVRGLVAAWRAALRGASVRDADSVATDDGSGLERLRQLLRSEQLRCDDRRLAAQLSTADPSGSRVVRAVAEVARLDLAGRLPGSPLNNNVRIDW